MAIIRITKKLLREAGQDITLRVPYNQGAGWRVAYEADHLDLIASKRKKQATSCVEEYRFRVKKPGKCSCYFEYLGSSEKSGRATSPRSYKLDIRLTP